MNREFNDRAAMKINFVLPPIPRISGGPLAILEYAERLLKKGHDVSITTYSDLFWDGDNPFPWFKFSGEIHFARKRNRRFKGSISKIATGIKLLKFFLFGLRSWSLLRARSAFFARLLLSYGSVAHVGWPGEHKPIGFRIFLLEFFRCIEVAEHIPDCDINIATWWMTAFPVLWSGKGKPVYFMQHFEEVFYGNSASELIPKLMCRMSYELPMFKVANSSWLANVIKTKYGQTVPFSTNGIDLSDFKPKAKLSESDRRIRIVTYSHPSDWKGLADAFEIMSRVNAKVQHPIEWHLFGYSHPKIPPTNSLAPYTYHPKLSFAELSSLYAQSDILLFCSWYESFPLPPLEAMASGTAVVSTSYGTEEYAHDDDTALVFGPRDIEGGVERVMRLIDSTELRNRLAQRGLQKAEDFSWERAVTVREGILRDIYEGKVSYDRFLPITSGFTDGHGRPFSSMPIDISIQEGALVAGDDINEVWLVKSGRKHRIHKFDSSKVRRISEIELFRIPTGFEDF